MKTAEATPIVLIDHLRSAVAAELTTIPMYLYAYWSIKPASEGGSPTAQQVRESLDVVISEEMLHMGLASNLLNALGGTPCLTQPPYLPEYPGHLLRSVGHVDHRSAEVDLLPFEAALPKMIQVELPEWDQPGAPTLGEFYEDHIVALFPTDDAAFACGHQIAPWGNPGPGRLRPIIDRASATDAVQEIVAQGEGLSPLTHDDGDHEDAHFWRFEAMRTAVEDGSFRIPGDVRPVIGSPTLHVGDYSEEQRAANDRFNEAYSRMLDALETMLVGDSPNVYPVAAGLMRSLHLLADQLRDTGHVPGTDLLPGPTFEYRAPADPRPST